MILQGYLPDVEPFGIGNLLRHCCSCLFCHFISRTSNALKPPTHHKLATHGSR